MNMQDSGWQLQKLKYSCIINPNCPITPSVETVVSYAPMECVRRGYIEPKEIVYGDVPTGLTYFADGDIIMAKVTPCFENGNIGIAENLRAGIGYGSSELFVFRSQSLDTRWLFYYLQNPDFVNRARATMTGTGGLKRVSPSFIRNHSFFAPSIAEQSRIAAYLDRRCAAIDALIVNQQQQIDKLKQYKQAVITEAVTRGLDPSVRMKDSGVEWIGEVPEHWKIIRGKWLFHETNERSKTGEEELLSVSHITGISPRSQKNVNMFMAESLVDYKICHVNDIASNTMWMWQGAIGVSKFHGVISPSYNTYRQTNNDYDSRYLDYMLRIEPIIHEYISRSSGIVASRLRLYPDDFFEIMFFVPPKNEQQEIVAYLDTKCAQIDDLIALKQQKADKLAQYKKSLIYEVVTGKKEIE